MARQRARNAASNGRGLSFFICRFPRLGTIKPHIAESSRACLFFRRCARSASPNVDPFSDDMDWTCSTFEAADLGKASLAFAPSPVKGAGAQARR